MDTTFEVEEDINFTTSVTGVDVTTCGGDDGWATVTVNNAVGTPDIIWSNGETSNTIQNLTKGWYYVWVTDTSTNCERKDSVEIKEPVIEVSISGGGTRTICLGDPIPDFTLTANATHCAGCTYHWSTGAPQKLLFGRALILLPQRHRGCSGEAAPLFTYESGLR